MISTSITLLLGNSMQCLGFEGNVFVQVVLMCSALMKQPPKAEIVGTVGWEKGTSAYKASMRPGAVSWDPAAE